MTGTRTIPKPRSVAMATRKPNPMAKLDAVLIMPTTQKHQSVVPGVISKAKVETKMHAAEAEPTTPGSSCAAKAMRSRAKPVEK